MTDYEATFGAVNKKVHIEWSPNALVRWRQFLWLVGMNQLQQVQDSSRRFSDKVQFFHA